MQPSPARRRPFHACWILLAAALLVAGTAGSSAIGVPGGEKPLPENAVSDTVQFTFGVVADAQHCDCEPNVESNRYYRRSPRRLKAAVQHFNEADVTLALHLGDFIEEDYESFDRMIPIWQQLEGAGYHVLGNHDFSVDSAYVDEVPGRLGREERYYSFSPHRKWRFIGLDGTDLSLFATRAGTEKREQAEAMLQRLQENEAPNASTWNGGMSEEQLAWLERTLEEASEAGQKVILFSHWPVLPAENIHNLWNSEEVVRLIESYDNVVAYMNGHNHAGNYVQHNGVHYLNLKGMVNTPDQTAYAEVEVYADHLVVNGFGREPDRQLAFEASTKASEGTSAGGTSTSSQP